MTRMFRHMFVLEVGLWTFGWEIWTRHFLGFKTLTWMTWRRRRLIELNCKTWCLSRRKSRVHYERSGPTRSRKSEQHSRSRALRQAWPNQSLWLTNIVCEDANTDAVRDVSKKTRERVFGKDTPKRAPKRKQRRRSCGLVRLCHFFEWRASMPRRSSAGSRNGGFTKTSLLAMARSHAPSTWADLEVLGRDR